MQNRRLTKSSNKIFAGVLGGIAEYFSIDPTIVRIVYAVLSILSMGFPGFTLYIILMIVMPESNRQGRSYRMHSEDEQRNPYYTSEQKKSDNSKNEQPRHDDWSDF